MIKIIKSSIKLLYLLRERNFHCTPKVMSLILKTDYSLPAFSHKATYFDGQKQVEGIIKSTRQITLYQSCRVVYQNKMLIYTSTSLDATYAYEVADCKLLEIARFDSVFFQRL